MIDKKLLERQLSFYREKDMLLKPEVFNKNVLPSLLKKFTNYGMTENFYCCNGDELCCWQEIVEQGNWNLTLESVKENIKRNVKFTKKYLYNQSKYGKRLYKYEDEYGCHIYIYLRDIFKVDYAIWFNNEKE